MNGNNIIDLSNDYTQSIELAVDNSTRMIINASNLASTNNAASKQFKSFRIKGSGKLQTTIRPSHSVASDTPRRNKGGKASSLTSLDDEMRFMPQNIYNRGRICELNRVYLNMPSQARAKLPLLIIHFEGLIGSCMVQVREKTAKEKERDGNSGKMNPEDFFSLRKDVKNELKTLSRSFLVVVIFPFLTDKYKFTMRHFINNKFIVDGAYSKASAPDCTGHKNISGLLLNYNTIVMDFKAKTNQKKIFILIPINVSSSLIKKNFIYNEDATPKNVQNPRHYDLAPFQQFFPKVPVPSTCLKVVYIPNFIMEDRSENHATLFKTSFSPITKLAFKLLKTVEADSTALHTPVDPQESLETSLLGSREGKREPEGQEQCKQDGNSDKSPIHSGVKNPSSISNDGKGHHRQEMKLIAPSSHTGGHGSPGFIITGLTNMSPRAKKGLEINTATRNVTANTSSGMQGSDLSGSGHLGHMSGQGSPFGKSLQGGVLGVSIMKKEPRDLSPEKKPSIESSKIKYRPGETLSGVQDDSSPRIGRTVGGTLYGKVGKAGSEKEGLKDLLEIRHTQSDVSPAIKDDKECLRVMDMTLLMDEIERMRKFGARFRVFEAIKEKNSVIKGQLFTSLDQSSMRQKLIEDIAEMQKVIRVAKGNNAVSNKVSVVGTVATLFNNNGYMFKTYERDQFYTNKRSTAVISDIGNFLQDDKEKRISDFLHVEGRDFDLGGEEKGRTEAGRKRKVSIKAFSVSVTPKRKTSMKEKMSLEVLGKGRGGEEEELAGMQVIKELIPCVKLYFED